MRVNKEWMVPKYVSQVTEWVVKMIKIVRENSNRKEKSKPWMAGGRGGGMNLSMNRLNLLQGHKGKGCKCTENNGPGSGWRPESMI